MAFKVMRERSEPESFLSLPLQKVSLRHHPADLNYVPPRRQYEGVFSHLGGAASGDQFCFRQSHHP